MSGTGLPQPRHLAGSLELNWKKQPVPISWFVCFGSAPSHLGTVCCQRKRFLLGPRSLQMRRQLCGQENHVRCLWEPWFGRKRTRRLEGMMERCAHANGNQRKAGVAILVSDKRDFKTKLYKKTKEVVFYTMVKESI